MAYATRFDAGNIPNDCALYRPTKQQFLMLQRALGGETEDDTAAKEISFSFRQARALIDICREYLGVVTSVESSPQIGQFKKALKRAHDGSKGLIQYGRNNRTFAKDPNNPNSAEEDLDFQIKHYLSLNAPARGIGVDDLVTDQPMPDTVRAWLETKNLALRLTPLVVGYAGEAMGDAFDNLYRPQATNLPYPRQADLIFFAKLKSWCSKHKFPTRIKSGPCGQQPMEICWFAFRLLHTFPKHTGIYRPITVKGVMDKFRLLDD